MARELIIHNAILKIKIYSRMQSSGLTSREYFRKKCEWCLSRS
jgi:hypothetical protein